MLFYNIPSVKFTIHVQQYRQGISLSLNRSIKESIPINTLATGVQQVLMLLYIIMHYIVQVNICKQLVFC